MMYDNLRIYQLEFKCRERGLSYEGTRKDMITRLEEDDIRRSVRDWRAISNGFKRK